jgi:hypothetical protein
MNMADYQLTETDAVVIRTADMTHIPNDDANRDWQDYQRWLDDGGVPDPYVPPDPPPPAPSELKAWSDSYEAVAGAVTAVKSIGQLGWNNDDAATATQIVIAKNNQDDSDISTTLTTAALPGRVLRIEARNDATQFVSHRIESATQRAPPGGDVAALTIAISPRNSAGAPFANAQTLSLHIYQVDEGAPASKSIV